ncbi:hypothetical protein B0H11DRAFT_361782 [Mycena galericulata]|nr:hypothetical protein B0H11DRAFT_361782 [Mycena galericulata]
MATYQKKQKKPPACDTCKARRVLCHPQPNGAPCPRCVEKNTVCTTTPVPRGRPRKAVESSPSCMGVSRPAPAPLLAPSLKINPGPVFQSTGKCPDLNPDFVSHCLDCLQIMPQYNHPLINSSAIKMNARAVSFQLHLLPTQSRVLVLCIVTLASLVSFHESILGPGPRPESFMDYTFLSNADLSGSCGVRRGPAYRALRTVAFKAAWESGIILQPSTENAASCYVLDLLEQTDPAGPSRPWASAYISHIRALAPTMRAQSFGSSDAGRWAGFLMSESLLSTRGRTPMLFTLNDQLLLFGAEPPPLENLLASLEASASKPGLAVLWNSIDSYMFHVSCLARQLFETINGDNARLNPLSEAAVIKFMSSLSFLHSIVTLLLNRIDGAITSTAPDCSPFHLINSDGPSIARACGYGIGMSFAVLVLPFYRELVERDVPDARVRDRMQVLRAQAHDMAALGARELARAVRYLPALHYSPVQGATILSWAEFCAEDADAARGVCVTPEAARDLETLVSELKLLSYSLESLSAPNVVALIQRLESYAGTSRESSVEEPFDPAVFVDMFFPLEGAWMERPSVDESMLLAP